jgi:hypothetical protein
MVNFKSRQELYSWLGLLNFPKDFDYSSGAFEGLYRQNSMGISGRSFGNDIWVRGLSFWSIFGEDYNWIKQ